MTPSEFRYMYKFSLVFFVPYLSLMLSLNKYVYFIFGGMDNTVTDIYERSFMILIFAAFSFLWATDEDDSILKASLLGRFRRLFIKKNPLPEPIIVYIKWAFYYLISNYIIFIIIDVLINYSFVRKLSFGSDFTYSSIVNNLILTAILLIHFCFKMIKRKRAMNPKEKIYII